VLFVGNRGTGKTHLASALSFAGCIQGGKLWIFTVKTLVNQLVEMAEQRYLERMLKQLERQDLLILDELGYVPFSRTGAELLFEVISRAYEQLSLSRMWLAPLVSMNSRSVFLMERSAILHLP
jgi:DNA replication protein DnaC